MLPPRVNPLLYSEARLYLCLIIRLHPVQKSLLINICNLALQKAAENSHCFVIVISNIINVKIRIVIVLAHMGMGAVRMGISAVRRTCYLIRIFGRKVKR